MKQDTSIDISINININISFIFPKHTKFPRHSVLYNKPNRLHIHNNNNISKNNK